MADFPDLPAGRGYPLLILATNRFSDTVMEGLATSSKLSRPSLYLRDFLTAEASTSANRTAFQAAVIAAETAGLALCYDGAEFTMTGEPVRSTAAGMIHWATGVDTHKVTHTTRMKGPIRVSGTDTLFENLNLDGNNPGLTGFTGQNVAQSAAIYVEPTAHNVVVRGVRGAGFKAVVFATIGPYDLVSDPDKSAADIPNITNPALYPDLLNVTVDGVHSDGCWAAFIPQAITGWTGSNITGWYQKMPQSGSEAHLVYPTMVGTRYGTNGVLHDCHATGGDERHAFRPRGQRGFRCWNLRATSCPGLIQVLDCEDVEIGPGCASYDDKLNGNDSSGSVSIDSSKRVTQAEVVVIFRTGLVAPPGGSIFQSEDVVVNDIRVTDSSATTNAVGATAMYRATGVNVRCEINRPVLRAIGVGAAPVGIILSTANNDTIVRNPVIRGNVNIGIRGTAVGPSIIYKPGDVEGNNRKIQLEAIIKLVNLNGGMRPDNDPSIVAWHTGEGVNSSSTSTATSWTNGQGRIFAAGTWAGDTTLGQIRTTAGGMSMTTVAVTADADVSCQVKRTTATRAGIALRTVSATETLALVLTATGVELIKYVSGTTTVLASATVAFPGKAFAELRAVAVGTTIVGMLNGVQVITHTLAGGDDTTYVSANHGLFVNTASAPLAYFQRVAIRSAV